MQRMARRNAIIRHLPAVETLGSVTVICSDKTGTLTRNEMTVGRVITAQGRYEVTGSGYIPEGRILAQGANAEDGRGAGSLQHVDDGVLRDLARCALLCNDADLLVEEARAPVLSGDPTEGALLVLALKAGLDGDRERAERPRLDAIPFESEARFMATLHAEPGGGRVIYLKGAPERVLAMCERAATDDGGEALHPEGWEERIGAAAEEGYRPLALAVRREEGDRPSLSAEDVQSGFTLLGVVGLIDPPRPEAIESVAQCRRAGIQVKMITGDHALTARSIAAQMGIVANPQASAAITISASAPLVGRMNRMVFLRLS